MSRKTSITLSEENYNYIQKTKARLQQIAIEDETTDNITVNDAIMHILDEHRRVEEK